MKKGILLIVILAGIILGTNQIAYADQLNDTERFSVSATFDSQDRLSINATLRSISEHAYFYIEDAYWNTLSRFEQDQFIEDIEIIGQQFDNTIYPIETNFFGSEPNPGIDDDARITILVSELDPSIGGYFDASNQFDRDENPRSNEREMFLINTNEIRNHNKVSSFLAHEIQHLISFNQKEIQRGVTDDVWSNELRSEYATTLTGFNDPFRGSNLERRAVSLVQNPTDSLTEWRNEFGDYGQVALLGEYLATHFSAQVIADMLTTQSVSIASVDAALAKNGFNETMETIFGRWALANSINDTARDSRLGYTRAGLKVLRVPMTDSISFLGEEDIFTFNNDIKDWQAHWYRIEAFGPATQEKKHLEIVFDSTSVASFRVAYAVERNDGTIQYGNERLHFDDPIVRIADIDQATRVTWVPYKTDKLAGFTRQEPVLTLQTTVQRSTTPPDTTVTPEAYGLTEGDFIRAQGDIDIYIINQFGYKRLVLSPEICLQYGHLGARGCFDAVRVVTPEVRDAFATSHYYTNGETNDNIIHHMIVTGEDSATLQQIDRQTFLQQGNSEQQIFLFNTLEQNSYN